MQPVNALGRLKERVIAHLKSIDILHFRFGFAQKTQRQSDLSIPVEIKALREKLKVSQPVFAHYLNTSVSTVQKWESGAKRPNGISLKLLSIVQKHGLEVLL